MSSREKLIRRFLSLPKDFNFNELEKLLSGYGYVMENKGKTSGSRVVFKNNENRPIMIHKPHPENTVKLYALKQVLNELKEVGLIIDKED
jgi:hypothetical protein